MPLLVTSQNQPTTTDKVIEDSYDKIEVYYIDKMIKDVNADKEYQTLREVKAK